MAVVTVKAKGITNRDATPRVRADAAYDGQNLKHFLGVCAIANGDSIGSKYIFGRIPSNALISSLVISAPDIGTTTAADIGLSQTTQNGGAVVDADFFTAALNLSSGAISSQVANGNVVTLANSEKRVWELLGLSKDPCIDYDVVATLTAAADAAGVIQAKMSFCI